MQAFQEYGGFESFIQQLESEVNVCRKEQPFVIHPSSVAESQNAETSTAGLYLEKPESPVENSFSGLSENIPKENKTKGGLKCVATRVALLQKMLNILKEFIVEPERTHIRHLMDGTLPQSLKHIISNAEYYGQSLFLLANNIVTEYIYEEPSLLSSLQDNGLTDVMFHALLVKEIPVARDVLASLGNVLSALCLNARGLQAFVAYKPFEKLLGVLVSPNYLSVMRQRKCSGHMVNGASTLGYSVDELIRNQPILRNDAIAAIVKVLEKLCAMGNNPLVICSSPSSLTETVATCVAKIISVTNLHGFFDDDVENEDAASSPGQDPLSKTTDRDLSEESERISFNLAVPLENYILNVMRFLNAFLNNFSTADHCREFVRQKGLVPLMTILGLPNLPICFPVKSTCLNVSIVCRSILNLAHEPHILKEGLVQLKGVLQRLGNFHRQLHLPIESVLLEEFITSPSVNVVDLIAQPTPLLNYIISAHAYTMMFVYICQAQQNDISTILINQWGSELGRSVLKDLSSLYISLVWESTVLLDLNSHGNRQQLEENSSEFGSNEVTSIMETSHTNTASVAARISFTDSKKVLSAIYHARLARLLFGTSSQATCQALAELFRILIKLCVGSSIRRRQGQQIPLSPNVPSPAAHAVASDLTHLLVKGLTFEPSPASAPKFRLTFYICLVGFTSSMLFDEKRYSYHLMLHKFLSYGGLDKFFNTFHWALYGGNTADKKNSLENPEISDEIGEFLDAWLMLLEKMVNPRNVLKSPHVLPPSLNQAESPRFNPVLYLIHIHKRAFKSILCLWNRKRLFVYGKRVAESMLAVICHLLNGEKIIKERVAKGEDLHFPAPQTGISATSADVNQDHLTRLIDMGFSRGLATEALLNTNSLQQATDYLLMYSRYSSSGNSALGMELGMSEEDQMQRAIAMSLGETISVPTNQVENEPHETEHKEMEFEQQHEEPLSTNLLDGLASEILDGCINLTDALPDTVYSCCDLLISVAARNGKDWTNKNLFDFLLGELHSQMYYLLQHFRAVDQPFNMHAIGIKMPCLNEGSHFAVRLHLFALIFEEMQILCAKRIEQSDLLPMIIKILEISSSYLNFDLHESSAKLSVDEEQCRLQQLRDFFLKLLPFLVIIVDQYEKVSVMSVRKAPLLMAPKRQWKWFDERSGIWNNFTSSNNKLIDDAYKSGDSTLHIIESRRNYIVCLKTMIQTNEDTGYSRPIMLTIDCEEGNKNDTLGNDEKNNEHKSTSEGPAEEKLSIVAESEQNIVNSQEIYMDDLKELTPDQHEKLVCICVSLLQVPLEPDSLHAVMRLCLRLTRKHSNAVLFANMNGPKLLLSLTEPYRFNGFTSLTALLFRHIMEDSLTLCNTMEKVIRSATTRRSASEIISKEMHIVFRQLGPAACRDPELFTSVASSILCLTILPPSRRVEDESISDFFSVKTLKSIPPKSQVTENISDNEIANTLIFELLNALTAKPNDVLENAPTTPENSSENLASTSDQPTPLKNTDHFDGDLASTDGSVMPLTIPYVVGFINNKEQIILRDGQLYKVSKSTAKKNQPESSTLKNVPIIRKSGILYLLAELVKSYPQTARLITDYSFHAEDSELISEDCSAVAFILDYLLYSNQTVADIKTPLTAKVLIAAIASCNHSVEAQTTLVLEVRLALMRALSLSESTEKHTRIQALTELISIMIESCPSASSQNQLRGYALKTQTSMNNIVRLLLKEDIIVDLARLPHYLDLSSPHLSKTVNSALKPLETISQVVNPSGTLNNKIKNKTGGSSRERNSVPESIGGISLQARRTDVPLSSSGNDNVSQDITLDSASQNVHLVPTASTIPDNEDPSNTDLTVDNSDEYLAFSIEVEEDSNSQIRMPRVVSFADATHDDQQEDNDSDSNSESGHSEDNTEHDDRPDVDDANADVDSEIEEFVEDEASLFALLNDYPVFDVISLLDHDFENRNGNPTHQLEEVFSEARPSVRTGTIGVTMRVVVDTVNEIRNLNPTYSRTATMIHPLLERNSDAQTPMQTRVRNHRGFRSTGRTRDQNTASPSDNSPILDSVPDTLSRWAEASHVLDGDSIHDCVTGLKPAIIKSIEANKHDDLSENKGKRMKLLSKNSENSTDADGGPSIDQNTSRESSGDQNASRESSGDQNADEHPSEDQNAVVHPSEYQNVDEQQSEDQNADAQVSMEVTESANQSNDVSPAQNMPIINMPEENVPGQGDEIPEGVDPSFLEALPFNIRQEVIEEQLRLQRLRQRSLNVSSNIASGGTTSSSAVNPEFLAALPVNIQEEVLADMEVRLLSRFDPEESSQVRANRLISHFLDNAGRYVARYAHNHLRSQLNTLSVRATLNPPGNTSSSSRDLSNSMKLKGCFLLDHEDLACLLVLLFIDETELNTRRLHRVLRNLCRHGSTRNWVVKSLLSILERTKDCQMPEIQMDSDQHENAAESLSLKKTDAKREYDISSKGSQPLWLSISLEYESGCKTNVFEIQRVAHHVANKNLSSYGTLNVLNSDIPLVTINPLASSVIFRHVLDTLISLASSFPTYFLPDVCKEKTFKESEEQKCSTSSSNAIDGKASKSELCNTRIDSDFWDILFKLDSLNSTSRKGKAILKNRHRNSFGSSCGDSSDEESNITRFESSPLAHLMALLVHPVVKNSSVLTDRLLKLLQLISLAFPMPRNNPDFCQQIENQDSGNICMSPFHEELIEITTGTTDEPTEFISDVGERRTVKYCLKLAVEVLSSKRCSEEGFIDATSLLLRLCRGGGCNRTRRTGLFLLLDGARQLGSVVCSNILAVMHELKHHFQDKAFKSDEKESENDEKFSVKGTIRDRYTNSTVVITDPIKSKGGAARELQLPAMQTLTSKTSSQSFFLWILKLIRMVLAESKHVQENTIKEPTPEVPNNSGNEILALGSPSTEEGSSVTVPSQNIILTPILQEIACLQLSVELKLDKLWDALSDCLFELAKVSDHHSVLVLQPAVEAFFLVHAPSKKHKKKVSRADSQESEMSHIQQLPHSSPRASLSNPTDKSYVSDSNVSSSLPSDTVKFLRFAETHRTVLNQILRQSTTPLADGPFSVLVDHTKILDFDIKCQYFRHELKKTDRGSRRDEQLVHVRREHVFEDSYRELHHKRPEEWKHKLHIEFEGEEGEDAGGLLREWYIIIAREIFNPMYALFTTSPGDRVTYMINSSSHCNSNHLSYFKFVGRVIAKAVYDNNLLESYFTRSFYKHILGKCVKYTDMESEDYSFYQGLVFLFEHSVEELGSELTFSVEVQEFGVTEIRDLKPDGRNIRVCEENKHEYVRLVCQEKMTGAIRQQLKAFLEGFYEIIPKRLISIFNEQELELLISGLPNIDIDDLKANTEYHKYKPNSLQIQWLWRALRSFDQADRAKFLQFVTGTSKVPLQGFSALEGMTGIQKFQIHRDERSTDRLPSAHTCFNQLDLPAYETYDKLYSMLLKAIHECSEGFGFV